MSGLFDLLSKPPLSSTLGLEPLPVVEDQRGLGLFNDQVGEDVIEEFVGPLTGNVVSPCIPAVSVALLHSEPSAVLAMENGQRLFDQIAYPDCNSMGPVLDTELAIDADAAFSIYEASHVSFVHNWDSTPVWDNGQPKIWSGR